MHCSARNGLRRVRVLVATAAVLVGATLAAPAPAAVLVADQVDANGNFVGETLPDTPLSDPARGEAVAAYRPPTLQGTRAVAVIPVEFADLPLPFSAAQMRTAVFAGGDSVNAFMRETSFGSVSIAGRDSPAGDVYPTVQIAESSTTCDHTAYSNAALAALRAQGHDVTGNGTDGYHHYVYIWPRVASCGYAGLASVPGNRVWINGTLSVSVISHELGHNFGLAHADSLRCQDGAGTPVVLSDLCAIVAYGDPFETMGSGGMHFSGMTKSFLGWFGAGQSVRVTASATLTLDSSSFPAAGLKSIEIPRSATESWFVETRSIFGRYDNFAPSAQPLQGVLIRRHAENTIFAAESQLIDAHPATSSVADAAFVPGETFTDRASGIAVEVRARTPTSAVVAITIGGVTPPTEPPGTPPPPPPAPPPGTAPPPAGGGGTVTPNAAAVKVTTDRALAKGWTSRISVRRLAGGRVLVSGRVITRAVTCRYRLTTSAAFTGRCERLRGGPIGWRVLRNVRGGRYVTIVATSASGNVLMRKRMLVPATVGDTRYYRL